MTSDPIPGKTRALPELLAPAGSPEAFRAAIAAGADAVYLSGKRFGARKFAANFSDDEIAEAVTLAHGHGVRVYVTVNTLIHDRELAGVVDYLIWLHGTGVDAVLLQDMGIAALAREYVPGLTLHASTQMTIQDAAGVRWAAGQGFSRVVLPRELTLDEVRRIHEQTRDLAIGLEVFAHGALCYSYSGQCLLSSFIGGRSGNRGMCAQPCRRPYALVTAGTDEYGRPGMLQEVRTGSPYLLSPRDLCTYEHLPELAASPVVSLKIEGRMKSPEYVAIVVSTYRRALDTIAAGTWRPDPAAWHDLLLAFNRGFTDGCLFLSRHDRLMGRDAPDNRGLKIGTVTAFDAGRSSATVRMDIPLVPEPGDGLLIRHPRYPGETGFALNAMPGQRKDLLLIRVPRPVRAGSDLFLTSSRNLAARVRQMVAKPPADLLRPIPLAMTATVTPSGELRLAGFIHRPDGRDVPVPERTCGRLEPAATRPLGAEALEQQLRKAGDTVFHIREIQLAYDGTRFAPISAVNQARREFLADAAELLRASYLPSKEEMVRTRESWTGSRSRFLVSEGRSPPAANLPELELAIWVDSPDALREAVAAGIRTICYEPEPAVQPRACGCDPAFVSPADALRDACEICRDTATRLIGKLPRITRGAYTDTVISGIPALREAGISGCMTDSMGAARSLHEVWPELPLAGSTGLNLFNHAAVLAAGTVFGSVTLSQELSLGEIAALTGKLRNSPAAPSLALIVQGIPETMVTEDCLRRLAERCGARNPAGDSYASSRFMGIRDSDGQIFPVWMDTACRTHLGGAAEICLIEYLPQIHAAGIRQVVIDARHRTPAAIGILARCYREAVDRVNAGTAEPGNLAVLKERIRKIASGDIASGHLLRGLRE